MDDNLAKSFERLTSSVNIYDTLICYGIKKYAKKKASLYISKEEPRPGKTRREEGTNKDSILICLRGYVESLYEGISKRLDFRDKGGTTIWSEAPAEGFFFFDLKLYHRKQTRSQC